MLISTLCTAGENNNALKTLINFTITDIVAQKCIKPDKETYNSFKENYNRAGLEAITESMKQEPKLTKKEAQKKIGSIHYATHKGAYRTVLIKGCQSVLVKEKIKSFQELVQWKSKEK